MPSTTPNPQDPAAAPASPSARRRRGGRWIAASLVVGLALTWGVYRVSNERQVGSAMVADTSCQSDATTVVHLGELVEGAPDIRCESWDIGTGVTGYVWRAPDARAVVLLQHGWGDYSQRWVQQADELIPHLVAEGFSVYAFDMWGNGRSPGRRGYVDVDQAVQDHLAARAELDEQPLPVFLVGHSLGGLVTATSVVRNPANVAGMVLLAPAIKYEISPVVRLAAQLGGFLIPTVPSPSLGEEIPITSDAAALSRMHSDPLFVSHGLTFLTASGGASVSRDNWSRYATVDVPVLAMHGTSDGSTDPTGSSDLIDTIGSQDKTLDLVAGGQHALLDDAGADEVRETVLRWLDERAA